MKKSLIAIISVGLLAAACNNQPATTGQSTTTQIPPPAPTTQTYSNATYGFQFTYPDAMAFVTPIYPGLQDVVLQLQLPQSAYPKTNFGDADFSVSAQFAKSLADCLALTPPSGGDGFKTSATINGTTFYMTSGNDAGAGNFYNSKVYRTFTASGNCLELDETIHTANIGNFTPGTVTEVDSAAVQAQLDQILNSFKFNS